MLIDTCYVSYFGVFFTKGFIQLILDVCFLI